MQSCQIAIIIRSTKRAVVVLSHTCHEHTLNKTRFGAKPVTNRQAGECPTMVPNEVREDVDQKRCERLRRKSARGTSTKKGVRGTPIEEEECTRGLYPWSSSGGPVLGLDYNTVLCLWLIFLSIWSHDLKEIRENTSRVAPTDIRPPGCLARDWSQELNGSVRCSGGCINSTDSLTDVWTKPPPSPTRESNPRPSDTTYRLHIVNKGVHSYRFRGRSLSLSWLDY